MPIHELVELPPELLQSILVYLRKLRCLYHLALTSRRWAAIALPLIYRDLTFNVFGLDHKAEDVPPQVHFHAVPNAQQHLASIADGVERCLSTNPNLHHVRKLHFNLPLQYEKLPTSHTAEIMHVLERVGTDMLEQCTWTPINVPMPLEIIIALLKRQKHLKTFLLPPNIPVIDDSDHADAYVSHMFQESIASCPSIQILRGPGSKSLRCAALLLQNKQDMQGLSIENYGYDMHDEFGPVNSDDQDDLELFDQLFRYLPDLVVEVPTFRHLTTLRLIDLNFKKCSPRWTSRIPFAMLRELTLRYCQGTPELLESLGPARMKHLEKLDIGYHQQIDEDDVIGVVDELLSTDLNLRHLSLQLMHVDRILAMEGMIRNIASLQTLRLVCADVPSDFPVHRQHTWDYNQFAQLFSLARNLRQLSCSFPMTEALRDATHEWHHQGLAAVSIPNLVTLHLTSFPDPTMPEEVSEEKYWACVKHYALELFRMPATEFRPETFSMQPVKKARPLQYIGFGTAPSRHLEGWPDQVVYTSAEVAIGDYIRETVAVEVDEEHRHLEGVDCWLIDDPLIFEPYSINSDGMELF
ncbi:Hypothetical protein D9617_4g003100 [Elsinoe fawcettii]|nr:Hypothetical protein D9617_4g003100 [Elsinoe fawcettii]